MSNREEARDDDQLGLAPGPVGRTSGPTRPPEPPLEPTTGSMDLPGVVPPDVQGHVNIFVNLPDVTRDGPRMPPVAWTEPEPVEVLLKKEETRLRLGLGLIRLLALAMLVLGALLALGTITVTQATILLGAFGVVGLWQSIFPRSGPPS
jgi:hypothetical protein